MNKFKYLLLSTFIACMASIALADTQPNKKPNSCRFKVYDDVKVIAYPTWPALAGHYGVIMTPCNGAPSYAYLVNIPDLGGSYGIPDVDLAPAQ